MTSVKNKTFLRIFALVFACIFAASTPLNTYASLSPADYLLQQIDLYHRDAGAFTCSADGGTTGGTTGAPLQGTSNKEKIWNFLRGLDGNLKPAQALGEEQAAGLMGNIRQEAGEDFSPSATESGGGGYGIVQWTGTRRTALENAAKSKGVAVSDLSFQLNFLYQESNGRTVSKKVAEQGYGSKGANEWTTMQQQVAKSIKGVPRTAIENATVFWHNNFEVSADTAEFVLGQRGAYSLAVYTELTGKTAPGASSSTGSGSAADCANSSNGTAAALIAKTLLYAWPEHHNAPYLEMMPDYAAAIKKAQADGRYVGGLEHPGVDCGGFVTTLMFDSGYEPRYNYNAKGGNTTSQEAWAAANWQNLGNNVNAATLQPGDVAFSPGHTFVWVGTVPGFGSKIASASVSFNGTGWRTPMAGVENPTASDVTWYRKKA